MFVCFLFFLYLFKDKFELIRSEFLHIQEDLYFTYFIYHMFMKWLLLKSLQLRVLLIYRLMSLFTPVAATQYNVCVCVLEAGVGLGIGACCLTLENSAPGIYIHSLAPGSVAKMDGRLRCCKTNRPM